MRKIVPIGIGSQDHPARSQSLYRLSYRAQCLPFGSAKSLVCQSDTSACNGDYFEYGLKVESKPTQFLHRFPVLNIYIYIYIALLLLFCFNVVKMLLSNYIMCMPLNLSDIIFEVSHLSHVRNFWLWSSSPCMVCRCVNHLQPTCYVTHGRFNIQQLYALPTLYLCVLCLSENKQRLVPFIA